MVGGSGSGATFNPASAGLAGQVAAIRSALGRSNILAGFSKVMGMTQPICAMHVSVSPLHGCSGAGAGVAIPSQSMPDGMAWLTAILGASGGPAAYAIP